MYNINEETARILDTITPEQWRAIKAISAERSAGMGIFPMTKESNKILVLKSKDISSRVTELLHIMGAKPNIKGYRYLREAVILVYNDWNYMDAITKALYPDIAKKFDTTGSRVERSIRHSMEVIFQCTNIEVLTSVFSCNPCSRKPTNSEAIACMVEYLKHN